MELIAIKQRLDVLEAAVAKLNKQPAPEPSVKTGPVESTPSDVQEHEAE